MKHSGFTLIELIIVIVILGILAVTAAPRFIDFQSDARKATLQGVKAALETSAELVNAKSAIADTHREASTTITINGVTVYTAYGYPAITDVVTNLSAWADIDGNGSGVDKDWRIAVNTDSPPLAVTEDDQFAILPSGTGSTVACKVVYEEAQSLGARPTIIVYDSEC